METNKAAPGKSAMPHQFSSQRINDPRIPFPRRGIKSGKTAVITQRELKISWAVGGVLAMCLTIVITSKGGGRSCHTYQRYGEPGQTLAY